MFYPTSRVIYEESLRFFEEDIILNDHLFSTPSSAEIVCDYYKDGIGFILGLIPNATIEEQSFYYFVRLDKNTATLFLVNGMHYTRLNHISTPIKAPFEKLKLKISIQDATFKLFLNNKLYMSTEIDHAISYYHLGVYSQKGNFLHTLSVKEPSPEVWKVNTNNVKNGTISFHDCGFEINNCQYPAEIIQENIFLTKGTYYLNQEAQNIDTFLYHMNSKYTSLKEKNILQEDKSFTLEKDDYLTLYYSSKNGSLKNVCITPNQNQVFIETYLSTQKQESSFIEVNLSHIKKASFHFKTIKNSKSLLASNNYTKIEYNFFANRDYVLTIENDKLYLFTNNTQLLEKDIIGNDITLFQNIDTYIDKITVTNNDNQIFDWFEKNHIEDYLEPFINSPIIPYDAKNDPINISCSFRKVDDRYYFTNIERESFEPFPVLKLEKMPLRITSVYGIPKDAHTLSNSFYTGLLENIYDLTSYCKSSIPISDYFADLKTKQLILQCSLQDYKEIVVDYEKAESCAINHVLELNRYKAATTSPYYTYYYSTEKNQRFLTTPYKEQENTYIVLDTEKEVGE